MSSDVVHASATDVRRLASALTAYKQEVSLASRKARAALNAANWRDARKMQFEARYQDLQKHIDSFMSAEIDQMVRDLNEFARRLDDVRNTRM